MKAKQLRETFTEFFEARGHVSAPSSSLIPHDDSLLFTNSGMVPFKSFFLGNETSPFKRATTVQKCVRAGGKHNDLDEVGRTSRHLTFFEMLGNFSFGDYFKDEAIPMAWEFFTEVLGLDSERLWVTVHESDDEAAEIWENSVGISPDRIQRLDEDNWWRMADTGPNGPCSEIFWDMGPDYGPSGGPANTKAENRYIEIWNLVFMQFDQQTDGTQILLPNPSIDTGAGLERVLLVLQGVDSVWLTDEFQILLSRVKEICNIGGKDHDNLISLQILADHARSTTFLTNDGVVPSNEDRGYVLRRIIRRAVRHAYLLGVNEPIMGRLAEAVVDLMGDAYPELVENSAHIKKILEREEGGFRQTLTTGISILDGHLVELERGDSLNGEVAFQLHDTYGFPIELTQEITAEKGIVVDLKSFETAMTEQRDRARKDFSNKEKNQNDNSQFQRILDEHGPSDFVGYEEMRIESKVLFIDHDSIILDRTPFYAEAGGQVGDTGTIEGKNGKAEIVDTVYGAVGQHRHIIGSLVGEFQTGEKVVAKIDEAHRLAVQRHHTGTHLLHWALRQVLGDHVKQQGSWVGAERLRFDFSHFESMTQEQIRQVEDIANREIFSGADVTILETGMSEAKKMGAIAFFGEKYGEEVRVLKAGNNSIELCGGTHVNHLSDVGPVKIVTEGSIGANIRRIEAVAGSASLNLLRDTESTLGETADLLGVPSTNMVEALQKKLREMDQLQDEINDLRAAATRGYVDELARNVVDGIIVQKISGVRRDELRDLVMSLRLVEEVKVVVLGTVTENGGVSIAAGVSDTGAADAGELLSSASKIINGGGGKGKDFAMIGGKNAEALPSALNAIRDLLEKA
jgi:alanyl-tRNA synthetase